MCETWRIEGVYGVNARGYAKVLVAKRGGKADNMVGKNNSWEPYNKGMTHGFVLEFENQADLDYYLTEDPVHLEFSKNAKPLIEDSIVVGMFLHSP